MRLVFLVAALGVFLFAAACDWRWFGLSQVHEGGYIEFGLAFLTASFIPWRE